MQTTMCFWIRALRPSPAGILFLLLLPGGMVVGQDTRHIPAEEALPIIEKLEGRIRNASWRVEAIQGALVDVSDVRSFKKKPGPQYTKGSVVFEHVSGRYHFEREGVSKWANGVDDYLSGYDGYSFDGQTERESSRTLPGQKLPGPNNTAGTGTIQAERLGKFMDAWGANSGMGYFPPLSRYRAHVRSTPYSY